MPDGLVLTTEAMGNQAEIPGLQRWLANLPNGNLLAVRSSAVGEDSAGHSFAGIHETRLNVRPEDVPEAVRSCWASVTSPAALAYRRAQHLPLDKPKTAVLIQRMIEAVVSGVAFTVNPVHTMADGDTIFSMSTGTSKVRADLSAIGALAAEAVSEAILRAVKKAKSVPGYPSYQEIQK